MTKFYSGMHLLFVVLAIFGCGDFSESLGEDYEFVETNADNHVLIKKLSKYDNRIIIHSDVKEYYYNDSHIVGLRILSKSKEADYEASLSQKNGYFVIDKKNNKVLTGLKKKDLFGLKRDEYFYSLIEKLK